MRRLFLFIVFWGMLSSSAFAQTPEDEEMSLEARVTEILNATCGNDQHACSSLELLGLSEEFHGKKFRSVIDPEDFLGSSDWNLQVGDRVIVERQLVNGEEQFFVTDITRRSPLFILVGLFIVAAIVFGGFAAVRSLFGMIISFLIVFAFILPAILSGTSPVLVSVIGSIAIMAATLLLSHGRHPKTWAALTGTALSLFLTAILAVIFTQWSTLFGLTDENAVFLLNAYPDLDTRGLLLAGIIIGALGVLDDLTISQASAVFELKRANSSLHWQELYKHALVIGRDHIAAAVNTLVLAYAGASLPLLLLLKSSPIDPWFTLINREVIATEIVRTLVGSIGLLAAVPFTTLLASLLADRLPKKALTDTHPHSHH